MPSYMNMAQRIFVRFWSRSTCNDVGQNVLPCFAEYHHTQQHRSHAVQRQKLRIPWVRCRKLPEFLLQLSILCSKSSMSPVPRTIFSYFLCCRKTWYFFTIDLRPIHVTARFTSKAAHVPLRLQAPVNL